MALFDVMSLLLLLFLFRRHSSDERVAEIGGKRGRREKDDEKKPEGEKAGDEAEKEKKEPLDLLRTRTGGAYIPPAKLKMLQDQIKDKVPELGGVSAESTFLM